MLDIKEQFNYVNEVVMQKNTVALVILNNGTYLILQWNELYNKWNKVANLGKNPIHISKVYHEWGL